MRTLEVSKIEEFKNELNHLLKRLSVASSDIEKEFSEGFWNVILEIIEYKDSEL